MLASVARPDWRRAPGPVRVARDMPSALETIDACPLLESLSAKDRQGLAQDLRERRWEAGETITSPDSGGIAFFLLAEGTAKVVVGGVEVGTMSPGETFGEIGLLTGANRTAEVAASTDVQCWTLSQWNFKPLVLAHPEVAWRMLEKLAQRVVTQRS